MKARDHAYCGIFGSLALALPVLFHAFGMAGAAFLPMYWPLVALAFLVKPHRAVAMAAVVPLASSVLTGMPLLWPPLAAAVSMELAVQVAALAFLVRIGWTRTGWRTLAAVALVLGAGRFLHTGLVTVLALHFKLPAAAVAGASFLVGWPGVVAMTLFIPVFTRAIARRDGVCEVRFLGALRKLHLPERIVLIAAQTLRWFEALAGEAEHLGRAMELRSAPRRDPLPEADPVVTLDRVTVRHPGAREPAISDFSLTLARGERVALLGPNGSGKTTLLSLISGFVNKCEGGVTVLGATPGTKDFARVRGHLGVLFENPDDQFLFPTLREDVGYALRRRGLGAAECESRINAILVSVGLPIGNRPIASLSRGQRQRAAIAGIIAAEPHLMLLDEPTTALDDVERDRLAGILATQSCAMLIATHDRTFAASVATRFIIMDKIKISYTNPNSKV